MFKNPAHRESPLSPDQPLGDLSIPSSPEKQPWLDHTLDQQLRLESYKDYISDELEALKRAYTSADTPLRDILEKDIDTKILLDEAWWLHSTDAPIFCEKVDLHVQREHLQTFARHNNIQEERLLKRVVWAGGVIVQAHFEQMGLVTLKGLEGLWSLKSLAIDRNPELFSLEGIPTEAIERVSAGYCNLSHDFSPLKEARSLKHLSITNNSRIHSLCSLPTEVIHTIEYLDASSCGLRGDLTILEDANQLRILKISDNGGISSLEGIPGTSLEEIDAEYCTLDGDLSEAGHATKLKVIRISRNTHIKSLGGLSLQSIEEIHAYFCRLEGDHGFLATAPSLRYLHLWGNPKLQLDRGAFSSHITLHVEDSK